MSRSHNFERIFISVFIHFVIPNDTNLEEFSQPGVIEDRFHDMIQSFKDTDILFNIKEVQIVIHEEWAAGRDNKVMRQTLYKGDNRDLNFYMIGQVDSDARIVAPIDPVTGAYCTPPFQSDTWITEQIGDIHQDGCIYSTSSTMNYEAVQGVTYYWAGLCRKPGQCEKSIDKSQFMNLYRKIASMRFVPVPRTFISSETEIGRAHDKEYLCHNTPCFNELLHLVLNIEELKVRYAVL
ncbi:hypothetical protein CDD81_1559 [Ophiocordyceps australis]|uniref:Uncharacterized protein n=1 Tax=Ophiocordyceps australis TaxID=1399860 RepID=A0A2C5Y0Q7_9HYPO|nr:hypothetical protein CDD81_1559 [Ophiocordyceps australis]